MPAPHTNKDSNCLFGYAGQAKAATFYFTILKLCPSILSRYMPGARSDISSACEIFHLHPIGIIYRTRREIAVYTDISSVIAD